MVFTLADIIYYVILLACIIMSFIAKKATIKGLKWIRVTLTIAFITEFINEFIDYYSSYGSVVAHFYLLQEHAGISMFIISNLKSKYFIALIKVVATLFIICSFFISLFYQKFINYPGIQYNINCFIIILWACTLMFRIEIVYAVKISELPLFWLLSGLLLFYSGVFFFNGTYRYILENNKLTASQFRTWINLTLNYLFYLTWIYSFVCSIRMQKSSIQQ